MNNDNVNMTIEGASFGFGGYDLPNDPALLKALEAGSSADPSSMGTGGNTLQFQSLEGNLLNALRERPEDFKLMNLQMKNRVGSTVHQYTVNKDSGAYDGIFTAENAESIESSGDFARRVRTLKYMQTKREVTLQATLLNPAVGGSPEATEERLGTHVLLKGAEYGCFHGNEAVAPQQFNGYPQMIRNEAPGNVFDFRGVRISDSGGEQKFTEALRDISENGGEISDAFFPYAVAEDFQNLARDRVRFTTESDKLGPVIKAYPSLYGPVAIAERAGHDKMYRVKGVPTPSSNLLSAKPNAPTFALLAQASTTGTGFDAGTAGTYRYNVYAVNENGLISDAGTPANVAVAAGQQVQITITPDGTKPGTGFIVCRGKKDVTTGDDIREMFKVAKAATPTTVTLDTNDELPGTAEILLLSSNLPESTYQWDSFLELMRFDLGRTKASIPFLMVWYGTPDMKVSEYNGLIKNVGHPDVSTWFV